MAVMAKSKSAKPDEPDEDRHKPRRMIGLPEPLAAQLEVLAKRKLTRISAEAVRIIREALEREGLWPPPEDDDGK
jgi:hypothetical protein